MNARLLLLLTVVLLALGGVRTGVAEPDSGGLSTLEKNATSGITPERLKKHVTFLASDELGGRGTGSHGLTVASRYIASRFHARGLTPPGEGADLAGYYQTFEYEPKRVEGELEIRVPTEDGTVTTRKTVGAFGGTPAGTFGEAGVVFAGYGITDAKRAYDDYRDVDVDGKYVVIMRHEPNENQPDSRFKGDDWTKNAYFRTKYKNARKHGAKGVIVFNDPLGDHDPIPTRNRLRVKGDIPYLVVSADVASLILNRSIDELKSIQKKINRTLEPRSFKVDGASLKVTTRTKGTPVDVRNVVGVVEGSHPERKHEWIVVGAHYDALGTASKKGRPAGARRPLRSFSVKRLRKLLRKHGNRFSKARRKQLRRIIRKKEEGTVDEPASSPDRIYNGADDNASGTAGVLELARTLAALPVEKRPGRSVLFILFTAEEVGLFGSRHYANHPIVPFDRTAAMFNMDMIGRAKEGTVYLRSISSSNWLKASATSILPQFDLAPEYPDSGRGMSDHAVFLEKKVPAVFWNTGIRGAFHRPGDEWNLLNYGSMAEVVRAQFVMLNRLGRTDEVPDFKGNDRSLSRPDGHGLWPAKQDENDTTKQSPERQ